jgi:hypothetical protein
MDYFITKKIVRDDPAETELLQIAGPFRTVTHLIEAVDTLLDRYSREFSSKRFVFWIQETTTRHNLILEELPPDRARW